MLSKIFKKYEVIIKTFGSDSTYTISGNANEIRRQLKGIRVSKEVAFNCDISAECAFIRDAFNKSIVKCASTKELEDVVKVDCFISDYTIVTVKTRFIKADMIDKNRVNKFGENIEEKRSKAFQNLKTKIDAFNTQYEKLKENIQAIKNSKLAEDALNEILSESKVRSLRHLIRGDYFAICTKSEAIIGFENFFITAELVADKAVVDSEQIYLRFELVSIARKSDRHDVLDLKRNVRNITTEEKLKYVYFITEANIDISNKLNEI